MDVDLERRWKEGQPPFDGDVLLLDLEDDAVSAATLRGALLTICDVLHLVDAGDLWLNEDWHQHDGFLIASRRLPANEFLAWLASDRALMQRQHGDYAVYFGVYDETHEYLLRFYLGDEPDSTECYLSLLAGRTQLDQCAARLALQGISMRREPGKAYFDKIYAG